MLKFKPGHYIDEKSLTREEAEEFVLFLKSEIQRHKEHMKTYQFIAQNDAVPAFTRIVALTVVSRNVDDIEHTQKTIDYLEGKFDLDKTKKEYKHTYEPSNFVNVYDHDSEPIEGC